MNALELADWLDDYASNSYCQEFEQAATMLREQQSEIEALKKDNQQLDTIARKSLQNYKDNIAKELTADVLWMLAAKHLDVHDTWREGKVTEGIGSFIEAILKAQEDGRKLATPSPVKNDALFTEYNEDVSKKLWLDLGKASEK